MTEKVKIALIASLTVLILAGGYFYWFEYRAAEIEKECHFDSVRWAQGVYAEENKLYNSKKDDIENGHYSRENYEDAFKECLRVRNAMSTAGY